MICNKCGAEIKDDDKFCSNCGQYICIDKSDKKDLPPNNEFIEMYNCYNDLQILDIIKNINDYSEEAQYAARYVYESRKSQGIDFENSIKDEVENVNLVNQDLHKSIPKDSAYILALSPLIFMILEILKINSFTVAAIILITNIRDIYHLIKAGYKGLWMLWGIVIAPVYLFFRAKKVDKKYRYMYISLVCLFLYVMYQFFVPIGTNISTKQYKSTGLSDLESNSKHQDLSEIYLPNYLPNSDISSKTLYEPPEEGSNASGMYDYIKYSYTDKNSIVNWNEWNYGINEDTGEKVNLLGEPVTLNNPDVSGYDDYDKDENIIRKVTTKNILDNNKTSDQVILIGKLNQKVSYGQSMLTLSDNYYTIDTKSGTYKNCIQIKIKEGNITSRSYYAKGIGRVYTEVLSDGSYKEYEELINIKYLDE